MKITEMAEENKVKFLIENYFILQASLFKYLFEKYGENELKNYVSGVLTEDFELLKVGKMKKVLLSGISKITPSFVLSKGVELILGNQTVYEKPKYLEILDDSSQKKVIHIKKCNQKLNFNKFAKKLVFPKQLDAETMCRYRCTPVILKLMNMIPRFKGNIEYLKKGCIITFSIEK